IGSGERCGNDTPSGIRSFSAIGVPHLALLSDCSGCGSPPHRPCPGLARASTPKTGGPSWMAGPSPAMNGEGAKYALHLFDQLHLGAVGGFDEGDMPAVVEHFLHDVRAVAAQLGDRPGIIVGLHRDMLDPEMLL